MRFLTVLFCFGLLFPAVGWAAGESCTSDEDCAEGEICEFAGVLVTAVDCPPCPEGEECPPCGEDRADPDEEKGEASDSESNMDVENEGRCVAPHKPKGPPKELMCEATSDCPLGLLCEEKEFGCGMFRDAPTSSGSSGSAGSPGSSGSSSSSAAMDTPCDCGCEPEDQKCLDECTCGDEDLPGEESKDGDDDGGTEIPETEVEEIDDCVPDKVKVCVFDDTDCTTDADCLEGFICHEVEECWASSGTTCVCPADDPQCSECEDQGEPVEESGCEVVDTQCRPGETPCDTDADCSEGWFCMPLPEGAKEELGMDNMCLPNGWDKLIQAIEQGEVDASMAPQDLGGVDEDKAAAAFGEDGAGSSGGGTNNSGSSGSNAEGTSNKEEAKKAASGLCSFGNSGNFGLASLMLLILCGGLLFVRREGYEG